MNSKLKIIFSAVIMVIIFAVGYSLNKIDYKNEIAKQDLRLKCQDVFSKLHNKVESIRYGDKVQSADTIIWSPKTKTCLVYYRVPQEDRYSFLFEVWDYTDSDLVLSYSSENSKECMFDGIETDKENYIYKYNKKLEGAGCGFSLRKDGIDLLTNFEKAMIELGFKK